MHTVILTEPMHQAGMGLLRFRADICLVVALPEAVGIGVRTAPLPAEVLAGAPRLRIVAKHGVGFDNVDIEHLRARAIPMAIAAHANAQAVAEHTLMLMLAAAKHLRSYDAAVREGR